MDIIAQLEKEQARQTDLPQMSPGDTVKVHYRVREGTRERTQVFEGTVLHVRRGQGCRDMFTVRRVSGGIGVERIFPCDSPKIENVEIVRRGRVRRARLYYLRDRVGKKAKVREARRTAAEEQAAVQAREARRAQRTERRAASRDQTAARGDEKAPRS